MDEDGQLPIGQPGDRTQWRPEQPVMHEEKIHAGGDGLLERREAGVHCGADAGDPSIVGHLQAVAGAGRILKCGAAGAPVAVGDHLIERGHVPL